MQKRDLVRSRCWPKTGLASSAKRGEWPWEMRGEILLSGRYSDRLGALTKNDERSVATGACPLMGSYEAAEASAGEHARGGSHQRPLWLPMLGARPVGPGSSLGPQ